MVLKLENDWILSRSDTNNGLAVGNTQSGKLLKMALNRRDELIGEVTSNQKSGNQEPGSEAAMLWLALGSRLITIRIFRCDHESDTKTIRILSLKDSSI